MRSFLLALVMLQGCLMESDIPKIVIVGGGPAGIAAATYLLENNLTNIQILEAEDQIGGRINSVKFGDAYVDLGAEWCHGQKGNIVYEMVKDLDLLESDEGEYTLYYSSGKPIEDDLQEELFDIIDTIESELDDNQPEDTTLGDFITKRYKLMIEEKFSYDSNKLKKAASALDYYHLNTLSADGAFSWFDLAASDNYEYCDGDQTLNWKGKGYQTILDVLIKSYPDAKNKLPVAEKTLLYKEVEKIIWTEDQDKVKIVCSDKSSYDADHVIFTPSIGVLKETADAMFDPPLPPRKRSAIDKIGFAAVMKVWMYYSEPWWNRQNSWGIGFVWDENDKETAAKEFPKGPQEDGRSWVTYINEILMEKHNPSVVSVWITGPLVPEIENLSEDLITDGIYYVMNTFLKDQFNVTKPKKILQTKWYTNPHFRGVYSFQTPQSCYKGGMCADSDLAEPLKNSEGTPTVLFAGEATHPHYYSTVHGAIESGYREAQILVDLYK